MRTRSSKQLFKDDDDDAVIEQNDIVDDDEDSGVSNVNTISLHQHFG